MFLVAFGASSLDWELYVVAGCAYSFWDNLARPAYFAMIARSHANYRGTMAWNAISNQLGSIDGNALLPMVTGMAGFAALGWEGLVMDAVSVIAVGLSQPVRTNSSIEDSLRLQK